MGLKYPQNKGRGWDMRDQKKRRQQINPRTVRKHSQIVSKALTPLLITGDREQTDYGYIVPGHVGKLFETKYMAVLSNSTTPQWQHAKKVRVYRVLAGAGTFEAGEGEEETLRVLTPGDEVIAEPGTLHRLRATTDKLELHVSQDTKYEAQLREVAPVLRVAQVSASDLTALTAEQKLQYQEQPTRRRRRGVSTTLARENIARQRGTVVTSTEASKKAIDADMEDQFFRNNTGDMNVKPLVFDDESTT